MLKRKTIIKNSLHMKATLAILINVLNTFPVSTFLASAAFFFEVYKT